MCDVKIAILNEIHAILSSPAFTERAKSIHLHYPNLKSESRYRDAVLEIFNESGVVKQAGWRAFAEADKVDLVVTPTPTSTLDQRVHIEFKYQFTFDMACLVQRDLPTDIEHYLNGNLNGEIEHFIHQLSKQKDLRKIMLDCRGREGKPLPDMFILIVQDRWQYGNYAVVGGDLQRLEKDRILKRGITIHFMNEQINVARNHGDFVSYTQAWLAATASMLELIHRDRPFHLMQRIKLEIEANQPVQAGSPDTISLTSNLICLNFVENGVAMEIAGRIHHLLNQEPITPGESI